MVEGWVVEGWVVEGWVVEGWGSAISRFGEFSTSEDSHGTGRTPCRTAPNSQFWGLREETGLFE